MIFLQYVHVYFDLALFEQFLDVILLVFLGYPILIKFVILPFTNDVTQKIKKELLSVSKEMRAIWNVEKNIMIFIDDKTVEDFNKAENCICDFFEKVDGKEYCIEYIDDILWTKYILKNKREVDQHNCSSVETTYYCNRDGGTKYAA